MAKRLFRAFILSALLFPSLPADSTVVFNEIMYHPPGDEAALEWVELSPVIPVTMSGDGVDRCGRNAQ